MRISDWSSDVCSSDLTEKHLRYIERDGITRDGARGQLYGPNIDQADAGAFEQRSRDDRHQFRFILSADDALELADLKAFTRAQMQQVERDLGTRLDWVAVDHWDTDNPHTRSEEHTSELQSLMRISYAVFCLKKK